MIGIIIGTLLFVAGTITHSGLSKAEKYGKVKVNKKDETRIKIGYLLYILGTLAFIIGMIFYTNAV